MILPVFEPVELTRSPEPFDDPGWVFELKHDGLRALAYIENRACQLSLRQSAGWSAFSSLSSAIATELRAKNAILDGEIVCFDEEGRSIFEDLSYRGDEAVFYAFDLLWLDGRDIRGLPLLERKEILREVIGRKPLLRTLARHNGPRSIFYAQHVETTGCKMFEAICRVDMEGMVAKRKNGRYHPSVKWIEITNPNYTQATNRLIV